MLVSFVTQDDRPTSLLTPNLCWDQYTMTSMARRLSDVGVNMASSLQRNRTQYAFHRLIIFVDLSCPGSDRFLISASEEGYFKSPFRWLILDMENQENLDVLYNIEMPVDGDVVIVRKINEQDFIFMEAYKLSNDSEIIYTKRLLWHSTDIDYNMNTVNSTEIGETADVTLETSRTMDKYGVMKDFRDSKIFYRRRKNLRRHSLTMILVITDSNDTKNHLNDRLFLNQDSISKMTYSVATICFDMLNATEKVIYTNNWGYPDKNGKWGGTGVTNELIQKRADLGTLTMFTLQRLEVIDYIAMAGHTSVRFVFREPPLAYISNIFTLPFTINVWIAIVVCVLGCAIFLCLTSRWEASVSMHQFQLDGSWADVLILIIGAVLQQGCTLEPRYAAGRTVTLLLFVALTILYAAYSANIVVLLRAPSASVRSLTDLLNSPLKFGASDFVYNRYFFSQLKDPLRKEIYDKKIAPPGKKANYYSMKEGIEKIRNGLFAFHMELNPGYRLIQETYQEDEKCDLVEIDYINEIDPWMPGQKSSPYRDMFRINFLKIRESGIQTNIHRRIHVPRPRCSGTVSSFSSVGITDILPAITATLYGMLLAPVVLIFEIAYHRLILMRKKNAVIPSDNIQED